jgi:peptidylprolyl isomerase
MNIILKKLVIIQFLLFIVSCNSPGVNDNSLIIIKTTLGDIKIKLYDETPFHRDNFLKLIKTSAYENVSFHRVIKDFMIQAGDINTKTGSSAAFPDSLKDYTIPAEFKTTLFHKKGALAAAREGNEINPQMRSSGMQFYIVQGTRYTDQELTNAEQRINSNIKQSVFNNLIRETTDSVNKSGTTISSSQIQEIASVKMFHFLTNHNDYKISDDQKIIYKTIGGTPRLDGTYTVFGEVLEGLDVVDRIASVPTDPNDKPINDIRIIKIRTVSK